ncbi:hypothetical protein Tco_0360039, partial [Tanacetum coccineum]
VDALERRLPSLGAFGGGGVCSRGEFCDWVAKVRSAGVFKEHVQGACLGDVFSGWGSNLGKIVLRREREKHFLEKEVEAYRQMTHQQNDQFNGGDNQDSNEDTDLMETLRVYEDAVTDIVKEEEPEKTIAIVGEEKSLEIEVDDALDSRAYDVHIDHGPKSSQKLNGTKMQTLDNERTKLDPEVEWLKERLRVVQEGREKLNFSIDNREKESLQLQLLEDIAHQLQGISFRRSEC